MGEDHSNNYLEKVHQHSKCIIYIIVCVWLVGWKHWTNWAQKWMMAWFGRLSQQLLMYDIVWWDYFAELLKHSSPGCLEDKIWFGDNKDAPKSDCPAESFVFVCWQIQKQISWVWRWSGRPQGRSAGLTWPFPSWPSRLVVLLYKRPAVLLYKRPAEQSTPSVRHDPASKTDMWGPSTCFEADLISSWCKSCWQWKCEIGAQYFLWTVTHCC